MRGTLSVICVLLAASLAFGQSADDAKIARFREAQKHFQGGRFLEAAPIYEELLKDDRVPFRDQIFDRLIATYMRLGRCDKAIQLGERSLDWMKKVGDVKSARLVEVQMAACWWALGHVGTSERILKRVMEESFDDFPLASQISAYEMLARCQAKRGDKASARASWAKIEEAVSGRLKQIDPPVDEKERVALMRKWAESLRGQERFAQAETTLKTLLPRLDETKDAAGVSETWRELSALRRDQGELENAEAALDEAVKALAKSPTPSPVLSGDLETERSELFQIRKKGREAKEWRDKAIVHYQEALKKPETAVDLGSSPVLVFWKLQNLVQVSQQFRKALELTQTQAEQWAGGSLLTSKLDTEQGSLQFMLGATAEGRRRLREAVDALEQQTPWNLIELPRAYINLASVESTGEDLDRAEKLVNKTIDLYRTHHLADDAVLVEACNLRGTIHAQRGDYAKAITYFREGLQRCNDKTLEGPLQRSNLLLNIALLHKSQGELPEAIKTCHEALSEFEKVADPDALGFAAFDAGLANMYLAQNQIAKAQERTQRILDLCKAHGVDRGPLIVTARHIRGVHFLSQRDVASAEDEFKNLLALQERDSQTLLIPRTLNYLGLAAELKGDKAAAESIYRRALKIQADNQRSYPATHFITLWRLANVVKDDRRSHAQEYIDQAIRLVEKARLRMFGDATQRATFFAQFGPAFEQSVDWLLQANDVEAAFQVLTRGRSRTLMDQLQMSNLDPLETLTGPEAVALKSREAELRKTLASLRARAALVGSEERTEEETKKLLADFDRAQAEYSEVWREIWNASPEYHSLSDPTLPEQLLPKLRQRVLAPKTVLLVYHLGKQSSQALLVGDAQCPPKAYPLEVAEELSNIAPPVPRDSDQTLAELRGVKIVVKGPVEPAATPTPLPEKVASKKVPLTQNVARALIDRYRMEILDRDYQATRGFILKAKDAKQALPPQRPDLMGDVFLPKELRDRIKELKPDTMIVIPDGPLHTLPLEALVLEAGARPRFAMDELPPMVYVPSASILAMLADRPPAPKRGEPTLLSVSNPSYPEGKVSDVVRSGEGFVGFAGQLPRLPFTDQESKQIRRFFPTDRMTLLSEASATEKRVVQAVKGKTIVHIAAHGFADQRFGNLFGALALSPSSETPTSDDDGFLSLHEIYRLPLADCDVAVLSACLTHVGPQQPLEAGVTLANAFLTAGARRVVASHWSVSDKSTAQLMDYFFEALTREGPTRAASPAHAMQEARRRLRDSTERNWSSPFYWAPFVVLGTPD